MRVCVIQAKVEEGHQALMEVTKCNTECLLSLTTLFDQKKELEHKLNARQKKIVIPCIHFIYNIPKLESMYMVNICMCMVVYMTKLSRYSSALS